MRSIELIPHISGHHLRVYFTSFSCTYSGSRAYWDEATFPCLWIQYTLSSAWLRWIVVSTDSFTVMFWLMTIFVAFLQESTWRVFTWFRYQDGAGARGRCRSSYANCSYIPKMFPRDNNPSHNHGELPLRFSSVSQLQFASWRQCCALSMAQIAEKIEFYQLVLDSVSLSSWQLGKKLL